MTRVEDIDAKLLKVHADYLRAEARGDMDDAKTLLDLLDRLLDERLHLPLQRQGEPY